MPRIICPYCEEEFIVGRKRQKYCKTSHRQMYWRKKNWEKYLDYMRNWQKKRDLRL